MDDGPQDVSPAKYTLRALRTGYLYTYDEKRSRLRAYIVLPDGGLWRFPMLNPPIFEPEHGPKACANAIDIAASYCVDVSHSDADPAGKFWVGWSNTIWTEALLRRCSESVWRKKHMRCIDVPALLSGIAPHCSEFTAIAKHIPHFSGNEAMLEAAFAYSASPYNRDTRLRSWQRRMSRVFEQQSTVRSGFTVAINDPVGITSDLALLTLPTVHAGLDENIYRGHVVSGMINTLEKSIKSNARMNALNSLESQDRLSKTSDTQPVLRTYLRQFGIFKPEELRSKLPSEAELLKVETKAWQEIIAPDGVSLLKTDDLNNFPKRYESALAAYTNKASRLADLHTSWLSCKQLADWMEGSHDSENIASGYAYRESLAQCIGNGVSTAACGRTLERWLSGEDWKDASNLYARALFFNNQKIIDASVPHLKMSDIPMEGILNLYKRVADLQGQGRELALFDRLVLTTVNVLIKGLRASASQLTKNIVLLSLSLTGRVIIRPSYCTPAEVRQWITAQARAAGGLSAPNRETARRMVSEATKKAMRRYRADGAAVALEMDMAQLQRDGLIRPDTVKIVRIPSIESSRRWITSESAAEFRLGVIAIVLQTIALSFSLRDLAQNDESNQFETRWKFGFSAATVMTSIVDVAMTTLAKNNTNPLSIFIGSHWGLTTARAGTGALIAKGVGFLAGLAVAAYDIVKGYSSWTSGNKIIGTALMLGGGLSVILGTLAMLNMIAFWWMLLVAVAMAIIIPLLSESAVRQWLSRCYFGASEPLYRSLKDELKAYSSIIGG